MSIPQSPQSANRFDPREVDQDDSLNWLLFAPIPPAADAPPQRTAQQVALRLIALIVVVAVMAVAVALLAG